MKATIAVLGFILSSAAKHNVDGESLSSELQQLGLPKGGGDPRGAPPGALLGFGHSGAGARGRFPCLVSSPGAEHASGLCRSYEEKQSSLQESLRACSLRREYGAGKARVGDLALAPLGADAACPPPQ